MAIERYKARERFWAVVAAFMGGHLSEGQATTLLKCSVVDLRECVLDHRAVADELWDRYRSTGETIDDDIRSETGTAQARRQRLSDD